ncbi:uncharacterized protein PgNI_00152 [Pyricularia grisea]|uniref:Uncharacterized protein n=1 Tax=Pyricularia grisea TaxID=148305 RepID=A0A6P8BF76_PYRGI|nr:uncharacterized protein PgNI_00152 [Pyricularia grisea]TLD15443.1 hypothetical protein PgNI_00152 [Pyricularia grisea]
MRILKFVAAAALLLPVLDLTTPAPTALTLPSNNLVEQAIAPFRLQARGGKTQWTRSAVVNTPPSRTPRKQVVTLQQAQPATVQSATLSRLAYYVIHPQKCWKCKIVFGVVSLPGIEGVTPSKCAGVAREGAWSEVALMGALSFVGDALGLESSKSAK